MVGWQLATHMRNTLVIDALRMALTQRRPGADVALVVHSDAGSQYTSYDHTQVLDDHDVLQSIGTVGDALDNAMAESFVDTFKTELIRDRAWPTRTGLEFAIVEYLGWFNHDRLHSSLGDIPPAEFEALARTTLLQRSPLINIMYLKQRSRTPRNPVRLKERRENAELWTVDALGGPEWQRVREMARQALALRRT